MKTCYKCNSLLEDDVLFCSECGTNQSERPAKLFCSGCGEELNPNAKFCNKCGAKTAKSSAFSQNSYGNSDNSASKEPIIVEVSKRLKISGILVVILASVQAVFVILAIIGASALSSIGADELVEAAMITIFSVGALAVFNFIAGISELKLSGNMLKKPEGILKRYKSIAGFIVVIVWNGVLLLLNIISLSVFGILIMGYALAVSIIGLTYVRNYIVAHKDEIEAIEQRYA